jgi:predicted nuclease of predicted toxin-antitoxin system
VRFLLDENQSPRIVAELEAAGHDAVHVRDVGLSGSDDRQVLAAADQTGRVLISADTDFGEILAASSAGRPSVILLRIADQRRARAVAGLVLASLDTVAPHLPEGAVVVIGDDGIRVRTLPFRLG